MNNNQALQIVRNADNISHYTERHNMFNPHQLENFADLLKEFTENFVSEDVIMDMDKTLLMTILVYADDQRNKGYCDNPNRPHPYVDDPNRMIGSRGGQRAIGGRTQGGQLATTGGRMNIPNRPVSNVVIRKISDAIQQARINGFNPTEIDMSTIQNFLNFEYQRGYISKEYPEANDQVLSDMQGWVRPENIDPFLGRIGNGTTQRPASQNGTPLIGRSRGQGNFNGRFGSGADDAEIVDSVRPRRIMESKLDRIISESINKVLLEGQGWNLVKQVHNMNDDDLYNTFNDPSCQEYLDNNEDEFIKNGRTKDSSAEYYDEEGKASYNSSNPKINKGITGKIGRWAGLNTAKAYAKTRNFLNNKKK